MKKSDARRSVILDRLADHVLARGLGGSSLRSLASAAGMSDRMLLYYFTDKADMMSATLHHIADRLAVLLTARAAPIPLPYATLRTALTVTIAADDVWPYMCLWLEIASLSARGDALCRVVGEQLGRAFLAWGASQLVCASDIQRAHEAARLLTEIEGTVLLKSIGLGDVCAILD